MITDLELQKRLTAAVAMSTGALLSGFIQAEANDEDVALLLLNALLMHLNSCAPEVRAMAVGHMRDSIRQHEAKASEGGAK